MANLGYGNQNVWVDGFKIHKNKIIGRGGFALCFDCEHQSIEGPICVKIIKKTNTDYEQCLVERELEILQELKNNNHKNIIKIFHLSRQNQTCYVFMEKCRNGNLSEWDTKNTREGKKITSSQILSFLRDIIEGYYFLHSHHIIHRDLKPENLLMGNDGKIKISDFGLGKFLPNVDSIQQQTQACTISYAAPQVLEHGKYSNKCDVFSLGVIIYKLIFKKLPFGESQGQVSQAHENLKFNQIQIPSIQLEGSNQQKDEIIQFLRNTIVYDEGHRLSWESLFQKYLQNRNLNWRIRNVQRASPAQQSLDTQRFVQNPNINPRITQRLVCHTPEINCRNNGRYLERTIQSSNFQTLPNQQFFISQQSQIYKLVEIIIAKLNFVQGFIQQLDMFKKKFRMIFLTIDLMMMKFYLSGYQYSLLLNLRDMIKGPKKYQYLILICQQLKEKGIQLQIDEYNSNQSQEIIDQKIQLLDLFERQKIQFLEQSGIIEEQLLEQHQNEKNEELKELINKKEQFYNYILFIEEFRDKFVSWKKSLWDQDSNQSLDYLKIIAHAIKTCLLETEYTMHDFAKIDPKTVVYENREEKNFLKQYIEAKMPR